MNCLDEHKLAALADGRLAADEKESARQHVDHCEECEAVLAALSVSTAENVAHEALRAALLATDPASAAEPDRLTRGSAIGRYVVLDFLAAGGMGVVYSAYDPELDRRVALKLIRPASRTHDRSARLLREAQSMARLSHQNVIPVFDVGTVDDRVFFAMELIDGRTLRAWLHDKARSLPEILEVFAQAGRGLEAAHAASLVHRDFKPENVLIASSGRVCVTDFGLASNLEPWLSASTPGEPSTARPAGRTQSATGLAGTPMYMAPEQYEGRRADPRADQFSFAVALYEAVYGELPFAAATAAEQAALVTRGEVRPPPPGTKVPIALRKIILRALSPSPDARYPSMAELLAALLFNDRRRRRRWRVALACVLLLAVCGAGASALHFRRMALARAALWRTLGGLVPQVRTLLRTAHVLPAHDIRPERERVRRLIGEVESQLQSPIGRDAVAFGDYVLGEGYLALGEQEKALELLEAAWAGGERDAHVAAALGLALSLVYERQLADVEQTTIPAERSSKLRQLEKRYRDPALAHLRAAVGVAEVSPDYLQALIWFHENRFADAAARAHQAFAQSASFYEAGMLEANVRLRLADVSWSAGHKAEGRAQFAEARQALQRVTEIARSDDDVWSAKATLLSHQLNTMDTLEQDDALRAEALAAADTAQRINPASGRAKLAEAAIWYALAKAKTDSGRDPFVDADKARRATNAALADPDSALEATSLLCRLETALASSQKYHTVDPRPTYHAAIAACSNVTAAQPTASHYLDLGTLYEDLSAYENSHGGDPRQSFALAEKNLRAALAIEDDTDAHNNLGYLWIHIAANDDNPGAAVREALAQFEAALRLDKTKINSLGGMIQALTTRAYYELHHGDDLRPTLAEARQVFDRAMAIDKHSIPILADWIEIPHLEAEYLLKMGQDPSDAVERTRAAARLVLAKLPANAFTHWTLCEAELVAARWTLAQHRVPDLERAAHEAQLALADNANSKTAWRVDAEVAELQATLARMRGRSPDAALRRGLESVQRALRIDASSARAMAVRDRLLQMQRAARAP